MLTFSAFEKIIERSKNGTRELLTQVNKKHKESFSQILEQNVIHFVLIPGLFRQIFK